jgi:hypothetical protein
MVGIFPNRPAPGYFRSIQQTERTPAPPQSLPVDPDRAIDGFLEKRCLAELFGTPGLEVKIQLIDNREGLSKAWALLTDQRFNAVEGVPDVDFGTERVILVAQNAPRPYHQVRLPRLEYHPQADELTANLPLQPLSRQEAERQGGVAWALLPIPKISVSMTREETAILDRETGLYGIAFTR